MLHVYRPLLCVGRMKVSLNGAKRLRGQRSCKATRWVIESGSCRRNSLLIWRVSFGGLLVSSDQDLLMKDAIARADDRGAFTKRIPCKSETRSKILLTDVNHILAPG